jgi:ribonucleoside-diphosphate reductase alpha chain
MELAEPMKQNTYYTRTEAMEACLAYFSGDELAAGTFLGKYALRNPEGKYEEATPDQMHRRMAKEFARIENHYQHHKSPDFDKDVLSSYGQNRSALSEEKIYALFRNFGKIIPQGSVMSSLGNPYQIASLSNCIVLPEIFDSYGGIFYTDQQMAQLFKRRCGVGVDLSTLRPAGMRVSNAAGTTTGAVSFMERFSNTTREVAQNGRRGALMLTLDIAHPDIEAFVTVKQDLSRITGANISVRLSDEFMRAVQDNTGFRLRWPVDAEKPSVEKIISARALWETIITCAHQTAEPGLIFWDRQHHYSTSSVYPGYKNVSTNPCSEIAMQGGDSCRLIALNLFGFVENPFTPDASFQFDQFAEAVYEAQRLMDDLVDLELEAVARILDKISKDPEPNFIKQVEKETWEMLFKAGKEGRRTGLGFTALADTLAAMGMSFDGDAALDLTQKIMQTKCEAEFNSSIDMAIERGRFLAFDPEIEQTSTFVQMLEKEFPDVYHRMMVHGRRNISISTVAPTGTLSMLAQTSSGIEPVFMTSYTRRKKVNPGDPDVKIDFTDPSGDSWQEFTVYHHKLKQWMDITAEKDLSKSPYSGSTAAEIDWLKRVKLQSLVQKYTTHSISSTINLPADVSAEQVGAIYQEAWKQGLKGITVYREGSRTGVLIANTEGDNLPEKELADRQVPDRPAELEAEVVRFRNHEELWIAVIGILNNRPYEIFTGRVADAFAIPEWVTKARVIKELTTDGKNRYDFQYMDKEGYQVTIQGLSRCFNPEVWNYAKLISGVLRFGMPLPQVVDLVDKLNLYSDNINTWKAGVSRGIKTFYSGWYRSGRPTMCRVRRSQWLVFRGRMLKMPQLWPFKVRLSLYCFRFCESD